MHRFLHTNDYTDNHTSSTPGSNARNVSATYGNAKQNARTTTIGATI